MRAALQRAQVILVVFALLAQLLMACGGHRQKALATALAGVDGARDGFVQWDDAYQSEVVLTTYREQREHVVTAFELAYQALATAALSDEDTTFEVAMGRIEHLYNVMKVLMGDDAPKDLPTN
jgi:hypothetical protein